MSFIFSSEATVASDPFSLFSTEKANVELVASVLVAPDNIEREEQSLVEAILSGNQCDLKSHWKKADKLFRDGYTKELKKLIKKPTNGITPLIALIFSENIDGLSLFLAKIFRIYEKDKEECRTLITQKSDTKRTPLMYAALNKKKDFVTLLMKKASELYANDKEGLRKFINTKDSNGMTALMLANSLGNEEFVRILGNFLPK